MKPVHPTRKRKRGAAPKCAPTATRSRRAEASPENAAPLVQHASARDLARAVTSKIDLVKEAEELFGKDPPKNAGVRVRMWENLVEHLFPKKAAASDTEAAPLQIVWDLPAPARELAPK